MNGTSDSNGNIAQDAMLPSNHPQDDYYIIIIDPQSDNALAFTLAFEGVVIVLYSATTNTAVTMSLTSTGLITEPVQITQELSSTQPGPIVIAVIVAAAAALMVGFLLYRQRKAHTP
jgi:hypothetical protein